MMRQCGRDKKCTRAAAAADADAAVVAAAAAAAAGDTLIAWFR
jgi:hypothetical protein